MAQLSVNTQQAIDYANMYNTKYIQLNQMENEKIVNNLQKLHYLQNTISSKDKLIEQVNKNTENTKDIIFLQLTTNRMKMRIATLIHMAK